MVAPVTRLTMARLVCMGARLWSAPDTERVDDGDNQSELMRIDRWLWTARFFKTRGLAGEAVAGGRVHINGSAVKPSREVREGDRLDITIGPTRRTVVVRGAAERRVSAAEATTLYEETPESIAERERQRELRRLAGPLNLGARPTKRDRRRYDSGRR